MNPRLPRFAKGKFVPKNRQKYVGTKTPTYRSSWEQAFMRLCDEHPNVYQWARESWGNKIMDIVFNILGFCSFRKVFQQKNI